MYHCQFSLARFIWEKLINIHHLKQEHSRPSVAQTLMPHLPGLFRTRSWVPMKKNPIAADLGWLMVYCVSSLEFSRWGNSNENTQHTFRLKKIEKISLLYLLTWRYDLHSLPRTTPVSNIFPCSRGIRAIEVPLYFERHTVQNLKYILRRNAGNWLPKHSAKVRIISRNRD